MIEPLGSKSVTTDISARIFFLVIVSLALASLAGCINMGGLRASAPGTAENTDFSITVAPISTTVVAGSVAVFSATITPAASELGLSYRVSGLPAGAQATLGSEDPFVGTRKLQILTLSSTPPGTFPLTVTASNSHMTKTETVNLVVSPPADFSISVTPRVQTIRPGQSANYTVNVTFRGTATGPASLSVAGLPSNATATFDRSSITGSGSATLTITAGPQIITDSGFITVIGTDGTGSADDSFFVNIFPANFSLTQDLGPVEVTAGGNIIGRIGVVPLGGTPGTVTFSASGLPPGATATFNPATVTEGGFTTVTINTEAFAAPDIYTVTINGVDASGTNFVTFPFMIVAGNFNAGFFLTARPINQTVDAGGSASYDIVATPTNGPLPPLAFTVQAALSNLFGNVIPRSTPGTYELVVDTLSSQRSGGSPIEVTAMGPNGPQILQLSLTIDEPPPNP